jgi:hypothetical protein
MLTSGTRDNRTQRAAFSPKRFAKKKFPIANGRLISIIGMN